MSGKGFSKVWPQQWVQIILLVGFCIFVYFFNLGQWDLWNPDEPRYAQVAKEMVSRGDWILMHYNGEVYTDKPPLFFWTIALSSFLWGGFTSFSVRFPSAFFGTLTILLTFLLGRNLYNSRTAFFSGLILATSVEFARLSTRGNIDTTLTFFTTASIFCFFLWYQPILKENSSQKKMKGFPFYGYYGCMALATLTKGPVGFTLLLLIPLVFLVLQRDWRSLKQMGLLPGLLFFAAIVLAWYIPAVLKGGEAYISETLLHHTVERYANGVSHVRPIYYYFYEFPGNFFPWIFFIPAALIHSFSKQLVQKRKEVLFLVIWSIVIFLFFTFSKGKRALYLLPLYPAVSLMVGKLWDDFVSSLEDPSWRRWISCSLYGFVVFGLIGGLAIPFVISVKFPGYLSYSLPIVFIIVGGGVAIFFLYRFRYYMAVFLIIVGITGGSFFYILRVIFPAVNYNKSARFISQEITSQIQPGERVGIYGGIESGPYNYYSGIVPIWELKEEKDFINFMKSDRRVFCLISVKQISNYKQLMENLHLQEIAYRQVGDNKILLLSNP